MAAQLGPQLPLGFPQVGRVGRSHQQPHRMPPVQLGLDVRRHLDPVDHQVADQPVDHGVLHHHADQTGPSQVALAELGVRQILILESRHAGQYPTTYRHLPPLTNVGQRRADPDGDPIRQHSADPLRVDALEVLPRARRRASQAGADWWHEYLPPRLPLNEVRRRVLAARSPVDGLLHGDGSPSSAGSSPGAGSCPSTPPRSACSTGSCTTATPSSPTATPTA